MEASTLRGADSAPSHAAEEGGEKGHGGAGKHTACSGQQWPAAYIKFGARCLRETVCSSDRAVDFRSYLPCPLTPGVRHPMCPLPSLPCPLWFLTATASCAPQPAASSRASHAVCNVRTGTSPRWPQTGVVSSSWL